ncbi:Uncharacterised protein [Vibrio cholerae]|nr:Uncharacterised protein [Vibrio cholerae]
MQLEYAWLLYFIAVIVSGQNRRLDQLTIIGRLALCGQKLSH